MAISILPMWELMCGDCGYTQRYIAEAAALTAKTAHMRVCTQSDSPLTHYLREKDAFDQMGFFDDGNTTDG
jgi:hypothetical protein